MLVSRAIARWSDSRAVRLALASLAVLLLGAPASQAVTDIDGTYLDAGGYVHITLRACGTARCRVITRIVQRKPGEPDNDIHNDTRLYAAARSSA